MQEVIIWPAWLAGAGIGLLMVLFYWVTGKQLGVSRAYGNMLSYISKLAFFQQKDYTSNSWRLWFILGIVLGGFIAAMIAHPGEYHVSFDMGKAYDELLPTNMLLRVIVLFVGGLGLGFGARIAGGCTSGHVITGIPMLNVSSIIAGMLFFIGGIVMMQIMMRMVML
ncbi:YeeE/YedE family protein [Sulfuriferula nivalis]|uniref:Sulphur transport domain-containing protein n=1 Tax=Sulfuriferula nivalis TaxID=2675298 RepID=A0A809S156_9PROT|nr:YeeE/YedE thiosulfate transporter family protein [Sulfuriferula nivalis]BBP00268.1 hypothetical protein SFSGTM_09760 [Sulfuriferula nivalis]